MVNNLPFDCGEELKSKSLWQVPEGFRDQRGRDEAEAARVQGARLPGEDALNSDALPLAETESPLADVESSVIPNVMCDLPDSQTYC